MNCQSVVLWFNNQSLKLIHRCRPNVQYYKTFAFSCYRFVVIQRTGGVWNQKSLLSLKVSQYDFFTIFGVKLILNSSYNFS